MAMEQNSSVFPNVVVIPACRTGSPGCARPDESLASQLLRIRGSKEISAVSRPSRAGRSDHRPIIRRSDTTQRFGRRHDRKRTSLTHRRRDERGLAQAGYNSYREMTEGPRRERQGIQKNPIADNIEKLSKNVNWQPDFSLFLPNDINTLPYNMKRDGNI